MILFSESNSRFVVTVPMDKREEFERVMRGNAYAHVGFVTDEQRLKIRGLEGYYVVDADINRLKEVWKSTLEGV